MTTSSDQNRTPAPRGRSHTRRRILTAAGIAVVVVVIGLIVWDRAFREASPAYPGTSCPLVVQPTGHQPLAAGGVHRVALIGDSIMSQASCTVAESLAPLGIQTGRFAVSGSGLLTGKVDWLHAISIVLRADRPNAVMAIFIGNYPSPPALDKDGHPIPNNSAEFYASWQKRAEQLSFAVRAAGATMYWVSPPPMPATIRDHVQRLFDGYASIPGDHTVDAGPSLAGSNGQYVLYKRSCGRTVLLRNAIDGIHLTNQGARIYGQEIAHDFSAQIGLLVSPKPC